MIHAMAYFPPPLRTNVDNSDLAGDPHEGTRIMGRRDGYYDLDPPGGMNLDAIPAYNEAVAEGKAQRKAVGA